MERLISLNVFTTHILYIGNILLLICTFKLFIRFQLPLASRGQIRNVRTNQQSEHALADYISELAALKQQNPHNGVLLPCPGVFPTLESPALLWVLDMKT